MPRNAKNAAKVFLHDKQERLQRSFSSAREPIARMESDGNCCDIVPVGKRRDGGTRFWCLAHRADATAKYGKEARRCRAAHLPPLTADEVFDLNLDKYKGGVALWGAVPAVYDTTRLPMDRGIHIHARARPGSIKEMDRTFRGVRLTGKKLAADGVFVSEIDAIYFMVSSIFGYETRYVTCSYCGVPHLDKDWFSVHPHIRHLCAGCGRNFRDDRIGVGNPISGVREACGIVSQSPRDPKRTIEIRQSDFPGGIQIWGTNPALIWTSAINEEAGIHLHAFKTEGPHPDVDETYSRVKIDGVTLNPMMVRVLMAQSALPSLNGRVVFLTCPECETSHFAKGDAAYTPKSSHACVRCGAEFGAKGRLRKVIGNPLVGILADLARGAPRPPQHHNLGLLPETL